MRAYGEIFIYLKKIAQHSIDTKFLSSVKAYASLWNKKKWECNDFSIIHRTLINSEGMNVNDYIKKIDLMAQHKISLWNIDNYPFCLFISVTCVK